MDQKGDFLVDAAVQRDQKLKSCLGEIKEIMDRKKLAWVPSFIFSMGPLRITVELVPQPDSPLNLLDPVLRQAELTKINQQINQTMESHGVILEPMMIVGLQGHKFNLNMVLDPKRIINSPILTPGRN